MQTQTDILDYHFGLDTDITTATPPAPPAPPLRPAQSQSPSLSLMTPPVQLQTVQPYIPAKKETVFAVDDRESKAFSRCSLNGLTYNLGDKAPLSVPGVSVAEPNTAAIPFKIASAKLSTAKERAEEFNGDGIIRTLKIAGRVLVVTVIMVCATQAYSAAQTNAPIYMKNAGDLAVSCGARSLAMRIFNENLHDPKNVNVLVEWGNKSRARGAFDDAIAYFNQAVTLDPNYSLAYLNRGATYLDLKQPQKAVTDATKAIALDPGCAMAYNNRACTYVSMSKFALAVADFNKAISLEPNAVRYWLNRGNCYLQMKQYKQAMQNYDHAIAYGSEPASIMKAQARKLMAQSGRTKKHLQHQMNVSHN